DRAGAVLPNGSAFHLAPGALGPTQAYRWSLDEPQARPMSCDDIVSAALSSRGANSLTSRSRESTDARPPRLSVYISPVTGSRITAPMALCSARQLPIASAKP